MAHLKSNCIETSEILIRKATAADTKKVATLVYQLLVELADTDEPPPVLEKILATTEQLLTNNISITAFLAETAEGEAVGVLTLNECAAIYAGGAFGEISELYISPESRSKAIAPKLLEAAKQFGRSKGWQSIEVCAPALPKWERTLAFYRNNQFHEIGPRLYIELKN